MGMMMSLRRAQMMPREKGQPNNEIWYTSTDGKVVTPNDSNVFGAKIVSNTYSNDKGIIKFDGGLSTIGERAFQACSTLASITLPDGLIEIGNHAFWNCGLTSITLPESLTTIKTGGIGYCKSLTSITLPESVTTIGMEAFYTCAFTSINIPSRITTIAEDTFYNCYKLRTVTFPAGLTTIEHGAFEYCGSLNNVTIPASVTNIGYHAFYRCSSLSKVYCRPTTPPTGAEGMFPVDDYAHTYYVPKGYLSAYQSARYWRDYASDMVEYNFN